MEDILENFKAALFHYYFSYCAFLKIKSQYSNNQLLPSVIHIELIIV